MSQVRRRRFRVLVAPGAAGGDDILLEFVDPILAPV
jgi:hypothetical protein